MTHRTQVAYDSVAGYHAQCTCGWGRWHDNVNHASTDSVEHQLRNPEEGTRMNQYLVDYTVRNITTGDEEDVRVLELTDDEIAGFPDSVRDEIRGLIAPCAEAYRNGNTLNTRVDWGTASDRIVELLLPYISHLNLYRADYERWERMVLGDERILDANTPEDVATMVYDVLNTAAGAAIANWEEGFWEDFHPSTTRREVLENFAGFIQSWLETVSDDDDPELGQPLVEDGTHDDL